MNELSWTPERQGAMYCSPACGRGCTKKEHDEAKKAGARLAKNLGAGWDVRVWENLGWHYSAVSACGRIKVHQNNPNPRSFTAFLGDADCSGGYWAGWGETAQEAVDAVVEEGTQERNRINDLLAGLT